ncbi:cytochrome P450 [Coniochaeta sp. 2T2.1]|nr:cytochrome P450 [Coniochaeta sp. 2T2.1]
MLGQKLGSLRDEIIRLGESDTAQMKRKKMSVEFPQAPRSAMYRGIEYVNRTVEVIMRSPFPALHHWWLRQSKEYRYYNSFKDAEIDRLVADAKTRFESLAMQGDKVAEDSHDTCAMDLVLRREAFVFAKTGKRSPATSRTAMRDELAMLLVAGHDTTAITLGWGLKSLSTNQDQQHELRRRLRAAFPSLAAGCVPSVSEILSSHIPYLDGTLEEILRFANTVPLLPRSATCDTSILGHHIPKGTHIMCNAQFMEEPLELPNEIRSPSSQAAWDRRNEGFAMQNLHKFMPERWIKKNCDGVEVFHASALMRMQFSLGPRGCFGKKLAMQQLRIFLFLLVWNFEFLPVPEALNSLSGIQKILRHPQQCYVRLRKT